MGGKRSLMGVCCWCIGWGRKWSWKRFITPQQIKDFYEQRKTGEYIDMTYAYGPVRSY